jgi:hypothetical protein
MKLKPTMMFLAWALAASVAAQAQWFHFTTPISGGMSLRMSDGSFSGGIGVTFETMTANVFVDPQAQTVRIIGHVSTTLSAPSIDLSGVRQIPGVFPDPPTSAEATLIVRLGTESKGLNFDTGPMAAAWNPNANNYGLSDATVLRTIRIKGEYTLTTGGQTHTEQFTYDMNQALGGAFTYSGFRNTNYPQSVYLEGVGTHGGMFCYSVPTALAQYTAPNGVSISLRPGAWSWGVIQAESFSWSAAPVVALPGQIELPDQDPTTVTITGQPQPLTVNEGETAIFSVAATGPQPLAYRWLLNAAPISNGGRISGAETETLSITAAQPIVDAGSYQVVVSGGGQSATSTVATLTVNVPPSYPRHRAKATATVVNGAVSAIVLTDPGYGYTNNPPPAVRIRDASGLEAAAHAVVSNGLVVRIDLDQPGHGYSAATTVVIAPPPFSPSLSVLVKTVTVKMAVVLGRKYRLDVSTDLKTWAPVGDPFVAEDDTLTRDFEVVETGRYFRIQEVP